MSEENVIESRTAQSRLSLPAAERKDWRLVLTMAGVVLMLIAYALPMFPRRITHAVSVFSGGTTKELSFPFLIYEQHYTQTTLPRDETLDRIDITVSPVSGHNGSGWGWLAQLIGRPGELVIYTSYLVALALPIASSLLALALVGAAWFTDRGVIHSLIPLTIILALAAPISLFFAWMHQFDFSWELFAGDRGGLMPGIGFWGSMVGAAAVVAGTFPLRKETHRSVASWWLLAFAVGFLVWFLARVKPQPYLEIWRFIADGILVTLRLVVTSFVLMLIVSLMGGLGRISKSPIIYGISSLYVEIIRGIPLMVQLLFIWFALPQVFVSVGNILLGLFPDLALGNYLLHLRLNEYTAAVIGLTVCYGAYGSEIFRAGISSIHKGQMEAARSLGMSYIQAMRHVILPQAVRVILPPIGNEFVALLKDSSLVSVLAVSDLTRRGREYMARTFLSFDTWIMVALCYLVLTLFSSRAVEYIESKTGFER